MTLTQNKRDSITNALIVGMSLSDAYIYAGLTPAEIADISEDDTYQHEFSVMIKQHEYGLLQRLNTVMSKQEKVGKEGAVTWALEHMYPQRYANKSAGEGKTVNVVFNTAQPRADGSEAPVFVDPADDREVVEIHN